MPWDKEWQVEEESYKIKKDEDGEIKEYELLCGIRNRSVYSHKKGVK